MLIGVWKGTNALGQPCKPIQVCPTFLFLLLISKQKVEVLWWWMFGWSCGLRGHLQQAPALGQASPGHCGVTVPWCLALGLCWLGELHSGCSRCLPPVLQPTRVVTLLLHRPSQRDYWAGCVASRQLGSHVITIVVMIVLFQNEITN